MNLFTSGKKPITARQLLRDAMKRYNLTQSEIARQCSISPSLVSMILSGTGDDRRDGKRTMARIEAGIALLNGEGEPLQVKYPKRPKATSRRTQEPTPVTVKRPQRAQRPQRVSSDSRVRTYQQARDAGASDAEAHEVLRRRNLQRRQPRQTRQPYAQSRYTLPSADTTHYPPHLRIETGAQHNLLAALTKQVRERLAAQGSYNEQDVTPATQALLTAFQARQLALLPARAESVRPYAPDGTPQTYNSHGHMRLVATGATSETLGYATQRLAIQDAAPGNPTHSWAPKGR